MYALRNIEATPYTHFSSGRVISITYSVHMFVDLFYFSTFINGTIFEKPCSKINACFDGLYNVI